MEPISFRPIFLRWLAPHEGNFHGGTPNVIFKTEPDANLHQFFLYSQIGNRNHHALPLHFHFKSVGYVKSFSQLLSQCFNSDVVALPVSNDSRFH